MTIYFEVCFYETVRLSCTASCFSNILIFLNSPVLQFSCEFRIFKCVIFYSQTIVFIQDVSTPLNFTHSPITRRRCMGTSGFELLCKRESGESQGVRCTVYGVRCTVYGVRCTVYVVRCTVYGVRCTVYGVRCTVYGVRCTGHGARCTVYGVRCTVYGVQRPVYSSYCTISFSPLKMSLIHGLKINLRTSLYHELCLPFTF